MRGECPTERDVKAAIDRLITLANYDTGQSERAAHFLLAWWDDAVWGSFPISDLFAVDRDVAADMATIFTWIGQYPEPVYVIAFGEEYRDKMARLVRRWHPDEVGAAE